MHPTFQRLVVLCFGLALGVSAQEVRGEQPACAPDRVLIQFREGGAVPLPQGPVEEVLAELLGRLSLPAGCRLEESGLRKRLRREGRVPAGLNLKRFLILKLPPGLTPEQSIEWLRRNPLVEHVEPDHVGTGGGIPDDPNFSLQWHHRNTTKPPASISTPEAWEITTGSSSVIVAVLDTGLNTNLLEFAGRLVPGYDFVNTDADPADDHGHGTAVTGCLAATGNNNNKIAGVDWNCRIMPVKVLDDGNIGFYSDWTDGIDFAVANGAKVINLSAGGASANVFLTSAIDNAIAAGVIFVTITHNDGQNDIRYPGQLPQSITVGATGSTDVRWSLSNWGPEIDLVAPGSSVYTISTNNTVGPWSGTSFAAPLVSGVCALLAGLHPGLTQAEAAAILTASAEDQVGDVDDLPGWDPHYGWGRLNAHAAVLMVATNIVQLATGELLPAGSEWRYLDDGSDPGGSWRTVGFNDSGWPTGVAELGYGDSDEATVVGFGPDSGNKHITTYFRRELVISNLFDIEVVTAHLLRDDGAVVYLNGTEAFRRNMGAGVVGRTTLAAATVDGDEEGVFYPARVDAALLVEGTNLIAVEIHQRAGNSSDISFDLRLTAGRRVPPDGDGDGMPDAYEVAMGFDPADSSDALLDPDGDDFNNLEEYIACTDPFDAASLLWIDRISREGGMVEVEFFARSNKTYSIQSRADAVAGVWSASLSIPAHPTNRTHVATFPVPAVPASLYFRLVTP